MRLSAVLLSLFLLHFSDAACPCARCPPAGFQGACCHGNITCETQNWTPQTCTPAYGTWCTVEEPTTSPPTRPPSPTPPPPPTSPPTPGRRGKQWTGYWQGWANEHEDTTWYDGNIPGECAAGCIIPAGFFRKTTTYNSLNFAFVTLQQRPVPQQGNCDVGPCPIWDGVNLYLELSAAISDSSQVSTPSGPVVTMTDFCRFARTHPVGPKRCLIPLGGWSDWVRLGTVANGVRVGNLLAKLVLHTFADGADLDFEHLAEFTRKFGEGEIPAYIAMVKALREGLNNVTQSVWQNAIQARLTAYQGRTDAWHVANIQYLKEVLANPVPTFEISYTTRFNAFIDKANPFNYLLPDSRVPSEPYLTDDEGNKIYPSVGYMFDTVNSMTYDMDPGMKLNFTTVLMNFERYGGVNRTKINLGFEPGEQGGGGDWEGPDADLATVDVINRVGSGGAMIWAANPDKKDTPRAYTIVPQLVPLIADRLQAPKWAWGTPPHYTPSSF